MPEQLALEEALGDRRAVDGDERAVGATAVGVQRLGHELLAGAALAGDEHDRVGGSHPHDAPQNFADRGGPADDALEFVAVFELGRQKRNLAGEASAVERVANLDQQLLLGKRLLNVVERAQPYGLDGAVDGAVRGHHDDLRQRLHLFDRAQHVDAVVRAHAQIGEHQVKCARSAHFHALIAVGGLVDLIAGAPQHHRERRAHVALIVDNDNFGHDRR